MFNASISESRVYLAHHNTCLVRPVDYNRKKDKVATSQTGACHCEKSELSKIGIWKWIFFTLIRFYPCIQGKKNVVCVTTQPIKGRTEKQRPEIPERRSMQTKTLPSRHHRRDWLTQTWLVQTAFKWEREEKKVRWWKQGKSLPVMKLCQVA